MNRVQLVVCGGLLFAYTLVVISLRRHNVVTKSKKNRLDWSPRPDARQDEQISLRGGVAMMENALIAAQDKDRVFQTSNNNNNEPQLVHDNFGDTCDDTAVHQIVSSKTVQTHWPCRCRQTNLLFRRN